MDLLHGTLDTLILKTLAAGRRHGYGIAKAIEDSTAAVVVVEGGSLYPALYRMERKELIEADRGISEPGRRAKFSRIPARGRKALAAQSAEWTRFAAALSRVLQTG